MFANQTMKSTTRLLFNNSSIYKNQGGYRIYNLLDKNKKWRHYFRNT